jgi:4-amino-4-deoxy-L-arabinose transferase-like glycosyltransferase
MKRFATTLKTTHFTLLIILFIAINLIVVAVKPIFVDPAMYWLYGHHFSWVYFDSPPLVSWLTWGATALLGTQAWVIAALSLVFILASAYYLYLLTRAHYDKKMAELITLIYLYTPAITHIYFRFDWSYNNLLMFFWIMSMYYFYQAQKTAQPRYFYLCTLGIALAILSHFEAVFLLLALALPILALPTYRKLLRNKHTYGAVILLLVLISPYLYALQQSHWQSILVQFQFHADNTASLFNVSYVLSFFNDIVNDLNFFFILGCILIVTNLQKITTNDALKFFSWSTLVIFVPFLVLAFHTTFPMKYYIPFYYGFLLISIPFITALNQRYLNWMLWFNIALFILDSWNVIVPRFGVSPGGNIFYQQNLQKIAGKFQPMIKANDLLVGCTGDATISINQTQYSDLGVLAFYLNHPNTYTTTPGFFMWQPPIQQVLANNMGATVYYLCEDKSPAPLPNLTCGPVQTMSADSYQLNRKLENSWYWQKCMVTK